MSLTLVVVTPEATALEQSAEFVVVPLYDGEKGIAPAHAPFIGRLGFGEMRITSGGVVSHYYVDGGFVQVADDVVSVLTGRAVPPNKIDVEAAKQQLADAMHGSAATDEEIALRVRRGQQAAGLLRVAERA